jgi:hypothetical protein
MFVLVLTLIATHQIAFYSGDAENRQAGRPTIFASEKACQDIRNVHFAAMTKEHEANPALPAFKLECMALDVAPLPEGMKKPDRVRPDA